MMDFTLAESDDSKWLPELTHTGIYTGLSITSPGRGNQTCSSTCTTVEPLNYGHRGTTLKCLQYRGVRYTESTPGNVMTLSSRRMPHV